MPTKQRSSSRCFFTSAQGKGPYLVASLRTHKARVLISLLLSFESYRNESSALCVRPSSERICTALAVNWKRRREKKMLLDASLLMRMSLCAICYLESSSCRSLMTTLARSHESPPLIVLTIVEPNPSKSRVIPLPPGADARLGQSDIYIGGHSRRL